MFHMGGPFQRKHSLDKRRSKRKALLFVSQPLHPTTEFIYSVAAVVADISTQLLCVSNVHRRPVALQKCFRLSMPDGEF